MTRISAIVPATDAPATLGRCLAALAAADEPPEEVIVVDSADRPGPAAARNEGARRAIGELLVFVDADVEPHRDAFTRLRAAFAADPGLDALFGSYDDDPADQALVSRFRNLLHHHVHQEGAGPAETFWAGLGAIRRDSFLAVELAARWGRAILVGIAAYATAAGVALAHDVQTSPFLRPSIRSVERVSDTVQARTHPGETVLAGWPGYLFGTHAEAVSGYTNQFAPVAAAKVAPREAERVHVLSEPAIERLIERRVPRLVVERNWVTSPPFADWDAALRQGRYRLVATVETAQIYER